MIGIFVKFILAMRKLYREYQNRDTHQSLSCDSNKCIKYSQKPHTLYNGTWYTAKEFSAKRGLKKCMHLKAGIKNEEIAL
mgnify:CR=1 FL=1